MFSLQVDQDIKLVLANPAYAPKLYQLISQNRDYLSEWMSWPMLTTQIADCEASAKRMLHSYAEGKSMQCYIIYQGELVGTAGFNVINHAFKRVEIGYWLASAYQGKGIVTRACEALIKIAFNDFAIEKVQIAAAEGNIASRAVCERLGFALEGIIINAENLNGRIVSHAVYGKVRENMSKNAE